MYVCMCVVLSFEIMSFFSCVVSLRGAFFPLCFCMCVGRSLFRYHVIYLVRSFPQHFVRSPYSYGSRYALRSFVLYVFSSCVMSVFLSIFHGLFSVGFVR